MKIYDEDVRPLLEIVPKDDKKKSTTSKAVRKLAFIDEKAMNPKVGPGAYPPLDFQSGIKVEEKGVKYKDFKKLLKEKKDKDNARIREEKDRIEEIKGKIKGEVPKHPLPIPADIPTFDKYQIRYGSDKERQKAKSSKAKGNF